jgi:hypothetical protein
MAASTVAIPARARPRGEFGGLGNLDLNGGRMAGVSGREMNAG